jgi:hypothetical protein
VRCCEQQMTRTAKRRESKSVSKADLTWTLHDAV